MRAALLTAYDRPLEIATVPDPEHGPADAVLRIGACGICRSDWHVWSGDWRWRMDPPLPHVLGHELAGEVVAVGADVRAIRVGDRVTVPFHLSCESCDACRRGRSNVCATYTALGFHVPGGFAEYVRVPRADANLHVLPEGVSYDVAASLGCRYTSAYHGLRETGLAAGETIAVFGAGGLGLSTVQLAAALGARVIAVDVRPEALGPARRAGAALALEARDGDVAEAIRDATGGGAHVTVDALGHASTLGAALRALRVGGRHLQLGLTGAAEQGVLPAPIDLVVKRELRVIGTVGCPRDAFAELLAMVGAGRVQPGALVGARVPLDGVSGVLEAMRAFATRGLSVYVA